MTASAPIGFRYKMWPYNNVMYQYIYIKLIKNSKLCESLIYGLAIRHTCSVCVQVKSSHVINVFRRQGCPHLGQGHGISNNILIYTNAIHFILTVSKINYIKF